MPLDVGRWLIVVAPHAAKAGGPDLAGGTRAFIADRKARASPIKARHLAPWPYRARPARPLRRLHVEATARKERRGVRAGRRPSPSAFPDQRSRAMPYRRPPRFHRLRRQPTQSEMAKRRPASRSTSCMNYEEGSEPSIHGRRRPHRDRPQRCAAAWVRSIQGRDLAAEGLFEYGSQGRLLAPPCDSSRSAVCR